MEKNRIPKIYIQMKKNTEFGEKIENNFIGTYVLNNMFDPPTSATHTMAINMITSHSNTKIHHKTTHASLMYTSTYVNEY